MTFLPLPRWGKPLRNIMLPTGVHNRNNGRTVGGGLRFPSALLVCYGASLGHSCVIRVLYGGHVAHVTCNPVTIFEVKRFRHDHTQHAEGIAIKTSDKFLESRGPYSGADLRFPSSQPDTSLHCKAMNTGLVIFTTLLLLVLISPIHRVMARLSWPGWLVIYRDGLPVQRQSPIRVLTGRGIWQLLWRQTTGVTIDRFLLKRLWLQTGLYWVLSFYVNVLCAFCTFFKVINFFRIFELFCVAYNCLWDAIVNLPCAIFCNRTTTSTNEILCRWWLCNCSATRR